MSKRKSKPDKAQLLLCLEKPQRTIWEPKIEIEVEIKPRTRQIKPYKANGADSVFRTRLRKERGQCENCGCLGWENTAAHHILVTSIYPEFARHPVNVLILCHGCHADITHCENHYPKGRMGFYSSLPKAVRSQHWEFLMAAVPENKDLISAFGFCDERYHWRLCELHSENTKVAAKE